MKGVQLFETNLPALDRLLGGGIPRRQSIIVTGDPGSGKTILCSQIAFAQAQKGRAAVVATITSESNDKLMSELSGFSFFEPKVVGKEIFIMSAYPYLKKGPDETREVLLDMVRKHKASLLFIDGLRSLRDLWQQESMLREFLYEISVGLAAADCVGIFSTEYSVGQLLNYPEATTLDGIISLSLRQHGVRRKRKIEVVKLRGRAHLNGEHVMRIDDDGVTILPRLETNIGADLDYRPSGKRVSFGVPALDQLAGGGLPEQSSTLIAGSTGIGKTLLALHFAAAGAARGEKSVFVSFFEPPGTLIARARAVGLELDPHIRSGALRIVYHPPMEMDADELSMHIFDDIQRMGATRVVVDGVSEIEQAISDHDRARAFLAALILRLRVAGVTSMFVKEISTIAGPPLDFSDTPISVVAENLMLLRQVEFRGRFHRIFSILKMRDSTYERHVREFEIDDKGFHLLDPIRSAEGLLTGSAREVLRREEHG